MGINFMLRQQALIKFLYCENVRSLVNESSVRMDLVDIQNFVPLCFTRCKFILSLSFTHFLSLSVNMCVCMRYVLHVYELFCI